MLYRITYLYYYFFIPVSIYYLIITLLLHVLYYNYYVIVSLLCFATIHLQYHTSILYCIDPCIDSLIHIILLLCVLYHNFYAIMSLLCLKNINIGFHCGSNTINLLNFVLMEPCVGAGLCMHRCQISHSSDESLSRPTRSPMFRPPLALLEKSSRT